MTTEIKIPEQSTNPDLYKLRKAAEVFVTKSLEGEDDYLAANEVFEAALKALYGNDIFDKLPTPSAS